MPEFGRPHRHYRATDSTNERARALVAAGAPSGTIVTAARQTAGRGRHGRAWSAPASKALLMSAILRPLGPEHGLLPLAVPVAVCEAIESLTRVECAVKWPNDVWIAERKVAGVLIEARPPDWAVIGIGINVAIELEEFPEDLRWPATSIATATNEAAPSVAAVRDAVCSRLGATVGAPEDELLDAFRARDALLGQAIAWEAAGGDGSGAGVAAGIDARGNLLVDADGGERASLGSGEVTLRPA
jgi:BirA family transcriptional regulator, biotin operon repressor / biotin---[acetyl-CoA-carboxylase] ligase